MKPSEGCWSCHRHAHWEITPTGQRPNQVQNCDSYIVITHDCKRYCMLQYVNIMDTGQLEVKKHLMQSSGIERQKNRIGLYSCGENQQSDIHNIWLMLCMNHPSLFTVYSRYLVLIFDKMKIKEGLVYLGEANTDLETLERKVNGMADEPTMATDTLSLVICGVFTSLEYPYAHFQTAGRTAQEMYQIVMSTSTWPCTLNTIATDGSSNTGVEKMNPSTVRILTPLVSSSAHNFWICACVIHPLVREFLLLWKMDLKAWYLLGNLCRLECR